MKNIAVFLLLTIIIAGCNNNTVTKYLSLEELIIFRINNNKQLSNDSIENLIHSSINNNSGKFLYFLTDSINYNKKIISHKITQQVRTLLLEKKYRQNSFDICIKDKDTVFIDYILSYSQSYSFLFFSNHINRDTTPSNFIHLDTIQNWNMINIPYAKAYIGLNLNKKKEINKTELKIFFNSIDTIMNSYRKLRDAISRQKFRKGFDNLDFIEKISIIKERPLLIIIDFDQCECTGYTSPPYLDFD
jgi:hypothetical protein